MVQEKPIIGFFNQRHQPVKMEGEMVCVPRIGETVLGSSGEWKVVDVIWSCWKTGMGQERSVTQASVIMKRKAR